jgi:hypothetical protein
MTMAPADLQRVTENIRALANAVDAHPGDAQTIHAALEAAGITDAPPADNKGAADFYSKKVEQLPDIAAQPSVAKAIRNLHDAAGKPSSMMTPMLDAQEIKFLIICLLLCV